MWEVIREGTNVSVPALTLVFFKLRDTVSSLMQALLNDERDWLRVRDRADGPLNSLVAPVQHLGVSGLGDRREEVVYLEIQKMLRS